MKSQTLATANSFGEHLRHWRKSQGLSQLELALLANVSQRHLSFLESGRSAPTQEMILRLATVMELPLRTQNLLLSAAGFAPAHSETNLDAPEMAPIRRALDFMLAQQEPFPALVLDHHWNLLRANTAAHKLLGLLVNLKAPPPELCPAGPLNIMTLTLHPKGLQPFLENRDQVAAHLLQRLQREALLAGEDSPAMRHYRELLAFYPDLDTSGPEQHGHAPFLSSIFVKDGMRLNVFSTITTLGTPGDITLQELRIESLYPADPGTEQLLRMLAAMPQA